MNNTELLAAVRQMKESGELQRMAGSGVAGVLAQFTLAILEQPEIAWRHLDGALEFAKPLTQSKSVADSWKAKGWKVAPMFMLPPVTMPEEIKQRAVILPGPVNAKMGGDKVTRAMFQGMNMMRQDCIKALREQGYKVEGE